MKKILFIVLAFISCSNTFGQSENLFEINEVFIKDSSQFKTARDFSKQDSAFFEDENYIVRKTCSGEWGGTIWFKHKITGIEYSCEATCPVIVNKVDGKYIVTSTLAHMIGFSEIIEITNPDSMAVFKFPKPRLKKGKMKLYYVGDDESNSKKGTTQLVDSLGVLTIASFTYDNQLFHVVTDFKKTFITKIEQNKFVTLYTISNSSIWTYNPEVIRTTDGHFIVFFNNEAAKGYLDIDANKITLIRYN
jgi:hypothetical protein